MDRIRMGIHAMKFQTLKNLWTQFSSRVLKMEVPLKCQALEKVRLYSYTISKCSIFDNIICNQTLYIILIILAGDRVVGVNSELITGRSYAEVVQLIQSTYGYLQLTVVPRQDDILQMVSLFYGLRVSEKTDDNLPIYIVFCSKSSFVFFNCLILIGFLVFC